MKEIDIKDVSRSEQEVAESLLIDILRTKYPHLDLRLGTALRDILVVPDAAIHSWFSKQVEELRNSTSLSVLIERQNAGEAVDSEDVNRILSNFNMAGTVGTSAKGVIRVVVNSPRTYAIAEGTTFSITTDGTAFSVDSSVVANTTPGDGEVKLYTGTGNYYFFVNATCSVVGSKGNIDKGTVLHIDKDFAGFVYASAYGDFSGGSDAEDLDSIAARIPVALANRGLLNKTSTEAVIRDRFDSSNNPIIAVSSVGYGNKAQLRDKHNAFGIGVGGRVDIYVRNFTAPDTVSLTKKFTLDDDGNYVGTIMNTEVPGMVQIGGVYDPSDNSTSSFSYKTEFFSDKSTFSFHDIDTSIDEAETAGTVYRSCKITVSNTGYSDPEKEFGIGVIRLPMATEIQEFVDDDAVRNVGSDFLVRCPFICRVSINARCKYPSESSFDVEKAKAEITKYVNNLGFVGTLSRSEIACILLDCGASITEITDNYMLTGIVIDALGNSHKLSGDILDLDGIGSKRGMVTRDTCVFSTTSSNINIVATPV